VEYNAKSSEFNVFQRIASGDEKTVMSAIALLRTYNEPAPTTRKDLARGLTMLAANHGDSALIEMAKIHPDADFITANVAANVAPAPSESPHKNDCGCHKNDTGNAGTVKASEATKELPPVQTNFEMSQFAFLIIMTVGALSFLMVIAKNLSKE
jgi:hypothetical protein